MRQYSAARWTRSTSSTTSSAPSPSQRVVREQLLPIQPQADGEAATARWSFSSSRPRRRILETLLPRHVRSQVYRALMESLAASTARA